MSLLRARCARSWLAVACAMLGWAPALHGCGSTPPATHPKPAEPVVTLEASDAGPGAEPLPEPKCDSGAEDGTRCGPSNSRYCIDGRCLLQKDCSALCIIQGREMQRVCIEQARESGCTEGPCLDGATDRCRFDSVNDSAACATLKCGDRTLERQLRGE